MDKLSGEPLYSRRWEESGGMDCGNLPKVSKGWKGWLGFSGAKRTSEKLREVRWKVLTDWMHTFAENCRNLLKVQPNWLSLIYSHLDWYLPWFGAFSQTSGRVCGYNDQLYLLLHRKKLFFWYSCISWKVKTIRVRLETPKRSVLTCLFTAVHCFDFRTTPAVIHKGHRTLVSE